MDNLKNKPFNLTEEDIKWVKETFDEMTEDEKIRQLFCLIAYRDEEEFYKDMAINIKPAGVMLRPLPMDQAINIVKNLQTNSKIPMLIPANLEKGGLTDEGTTIGSEMQVAATDNDEIAYKLAKVCGREGDAVGVNWSFSPIIDIDYNFMNPITNTRTFGSDPNRVKRMGLAYIKGVQECGLAACIKHYPGDGVDPRDQHLVANVNTFSCEEWDKTFGDVYKSCIDAGAMTVMVGHIMLPSYSKKFSPGIQDSEILPASLSYEITTKLLKEKLGFQGLVVTDATTMAGMTIPMSREKAVPTTIEIGCDMFLFTRNYDEDYEYMKQGLKNGILTKERLDQAVIKILALKAALKLHIKKKENTLIPSMESAKSVIGCNEHQTWAKECADQSVTLVKEEKGVLPISPKKYKKVLFYDIEASEGFAYSVKVGVCDDFKERLIKEGFKVDKFTPKPGFEGLFTPFKEVVDNYDLIIYLANYATKSNQTTVRIEWAQPMGANVPIYMEQVPTIFISVENPYHLFDVPRIKTFINAYHSSDAVLDAIIDKLMGRSEFKGKSPIDPFCGLWDARL